MVGSFWRLYGGIVGLLRLDREGWEAIEASLLRRGFLLRDVPSKVGWRALKAMVYNPWESGEHLAAMEVDLLQLLVWLGTEDGSKGRNQPPAIPRPGEEQNRANEVMSAIELVTSAGLIRRRENVNVD